MAGGYNIIYILCSILDDRHNVRAAISLVDDRIWSISPFARPNNRLVSHMAGQLLWLVDKCVGRSSRFYCSAWHKLSRLCVGLRSNTRCSGPCWLLFRLHAVVVLVLLNVLQTKHHTSLRAGPMDKVPLQLQHVVTMTMPCYWSPQCLYDYSRMVFHDIIYSCFSATLCLLCSQHNVCALLWHCF